MPVPSVSACGAVMPPSPAPVLVDAAKAAKVLVGMKRSRSRSAKYNNNNHTRIASGHEASGEDVEERETSVQGSNYANDAADIDAAEWFGSAIADDIDSDFDADPEANKENVPPEKKLPMEGDEMRCDEVLSPPRNLRPIRTNKPAANSMHDVMARNFVLESVALEAFTYFMSIAGVAANVISDADASATDDGGAANSEAWHAIHDIMRRALNAAELMRDGARWSDAPF